MKRLGAWLTRRKGPASGLLAVLVLISFAAWSLQRSAVFQICSDRQTYEQHNERSQGPQNAEGVPDYFHCVASAFEANDKLIVGIGSMIVAFFTGTLWWTSVVQGRNTRAALNLAHRPHIRVKHVWVRNESLDDVPLEVSIVFTNIGTAPGRINKCGYATVVLPVGTALPPDLRYVEYHGYDGNPITLGFTHEHRIVTNRTLSFAEVIEAQNGTQRIYFVGFIEYLDMGEAPGFRRTNFARYLEFVPRDDLRHDHVRFRPLEKPDPDYEYEN